jgi:hypothetical protein
MNVIEKIVRDVAELPDRTSPADQPDMMLVSADELRTILERYLKLHRAD